MATCQNVLLMLAIIIQDDEIKLLFSKPDKYMFNLIVLRASGLKATSAEA